jgi:nitrilase
MNQYPKFRAACAHVAPVYLDTVATIRKACDIIAEAARAGANLVIFPEGFVPGFPVWTALSAPIYNHDYFKRFAASAIRIDGPEIAEIRATAARFGVFVSLGFTEIAEYSVGCLWNANVLIDDHGAVLNNHRKLVPTFYEKLVWANGDAAGLKVSNTAIGRIGALICGENTNPLARFSLMAQGEQVHISTWPPAWPTRGPDENGYDIEAAIRIRAGAHSFEAKVFNLVVSSVVDESMLLTLESIPGVREFLEKTPKAVTMIIGPTGDPISDVLRSDEGILYADIDISACVEPKQFHDVVGYYNRFDIFRIEVDRRANRPITFVDDDPVNVPADVDETITAKRYPLHDLGLRD